MGITKEFFCPGHGSFESDKPRCPHGCSIPAEREFLTAPAVHGNTTRRTDALVRSQVEAFGLSNIKSSREGETARPSNPQAARMAEFQKSVRQKYPSLWGGVPKGGTFEVGKGVVDEVAGGGAVGALAAHHAEPQGIDREALKQTSRPVERIRDPQNLKVDVSKAA